MFRQDQRKIASGAVITRDPTGVDSGMSVVSRSLGLALLVTGCGWDAPPVEWQAPTPIASARDSAARYAAHWSPGAAPEVTVRQEGPAGPDTTSLLAACPGSVVRTPMVRGSAWGVWWQIRDDSSAVLMAARYDSVGVSMRRLVVDSLDKALLGCARPAPAVAVDSINGYLHVGYFMVAPEGPGLFYAHLMDPRATAFELPMAVVYGERPSRVALASRGDTVAVAYEDPNSEAGRIAMSLSFTAGHLFEQTARIIPVSTSSQTAAAPQIVRLGGGELWVGWTELSQSGSAFLLRRARIVTR